MQRPALLRMNDPAENWQFGRGWTLLSPLERKSPGAPTPGQIFKSNANAKDNLVAEKEQARRAAEALFGRAGAA